MTPFEFTAAIKKVLQKKAVTDEQLTARSDMQSGLGSRPPRFNQPGSSINAQQSAIRLAGENNVNINSIRGTGPSGRIMSSDVREHLNNQSRPQAARPILPAQLRAPTPRPAPAPAPTTSTSPGTMPAQLRAPTTPPTNTTTSPSPTSPTSTAPISPGVSPGATPTAPAPQASAVRLAQEYGIDLNTLRGTGPGGQIMRSDVMQARMEKGGSIISLFEFGQTVKSAMNAAMVDVNTPYPGAAPTLNIFSAYPREEIDALPTRGGLYGAGIGGVAGGLYGLLTGQKGRRLRSILRGAAGGAMMGGGAGFGAGYMASKQFPNPDFKGVDPLTGLQLMLAPPERQEEMAHKSIYGVTRPELQQQVVRKGLLGGLAGLGGGAAAAGLTLDPWSEEDKKEDDKKSKTAAMNFGRLLKQSSQINSLLNVAKQVARPMTRSAKPVASAGRAAAGLPSLAPASRVTANPAWLRNNRAVASGLDPVTGLRPGAVVPKPPVPVPPPGKIKITPEDVTRVGTAPAAAGASAAPKIRITPEDLTAGALGGAAPTSKIRITPEDLTAGALGGVSTGPKIKITPEDLTAGALGGATTAPKIKITPEDLNAGALGGAIPPRNTPRDTGVGRMMDLIRNSGLRQ